MIGGDIRQLILEFGAEHLAVAVAVYRVEVGIGIYPVFMNPNRCDQRFIPQGRRILDPQAEGTFSVASLSSPSHGMFSIAFQYWPNSSPRCLWASRSPRRCLRSVRKHGSEIIYFRLVSLTLPKFSHFHGSISNNNQPGLSTEKI